jgi:hypothetical protein
MAISKIFHYSFFIRLDISYIQENIAEQTLLIILSIHRIFEFFLFKMAILEYKAKFIHRYLDFQTY